MSKHRFMAVMPALLCVLALAGTANAAEGTSVAAIGSINNTDFRTGDDLNADFDGNWAFGGGLLFGIGLTQALQLEVGGIYNRRDFDATDTGGAPGGIETGEADYREIQVPGLLRWWLGKDFSVGVGGYYSFALDEGDENDAGLTGSLGLFVPFSNEWGLRLDARYNYGLADLADGPGTQKASMMQGLAGLEFRM
jgi:hypothetical protein